MAKSKKGSSKGKKITCSVCGLVLSVDSACGCVEECDVICCGEQMKTKKK